MTKQALRNVLPATLRSKVRRSTLSTLLRQKLRYSFTVLQYGSLRYSLLPCTASKYEKRAKNKISFFHNQRGIVLANLLIFTIAFTVIGLSLATFTISEYYKTTRAVYHTNALMVAEAGIEQTLHQINQDETFAGYPSEQEFFNNAAQGRGTFVTSIANAEDGNSKTITATSYVYRDDTSTDPISDRSIKVTIVGTSSDGYSVHSGPGGLILNGSASITNADVYVNGTIDLNGSSKIGTNSQPLEVNAAHMACPDGNDPGPAYPEVCSSGEPISMAHSTNIYGTVCATNQTSTGPNNNIQPGDGGQGLVAGCVAPSVNQPAYDRQAHIDSVETTAAGSNNAYVCQQWPFDRTWPANLKLTSNVNIASSCNVVIEGDVYITGDLNIGGAASITVAESLGETKPVVMVDGKITVGGSAQIIANSQGTGIHFISYKSNASCGSSCTDLSGTELKNTQSLTTIDVGGAVNLPGMIFQAYWGKAKIAGSGNIGAAVGQTVEMSGSGTVTFGTGLSSGSKTWTITSYQEVFP
jgi:Tfp pilus assembly protein PilX